MAFCSPVVNRDVFPEPKPVSSYFMTVALSGERKSECDRRGYYWHEMVLGAFLSFSYLCAALAAKDVLLLRPDEMSAELRTKPA